MPKSRSLVLDLILEVGEFTLFWQSPSLRLVGVGVVATVWTLVSKEEAWLDEVDSLISCR